MGQKETVQLYRKRASWRNLFYMVYVPVERNVVES